MTPGGLSDYDRDLANSAEWSLCTNCVLCGRPVTDPPWLYCDFHENDTDPGPDIDSAGDDESAKLRGYE